MHAGLTLLGVIMLIGFAFGDRAARIAAGATLVAMGAGAGLFLYVVVRIINGTI